MIKEFNFLVQEGFKVRGQCRITNHDYEPYATERDNKIGALLNKSGISFHTYKDQVIFKKNGSSPDPP
ncbi:MAG: hypothetical protein WD426_09340 [Anditalea sp.]